MPLKETIQLINEMKADGVISEYAIGGAVGATFYLEPASTIASQLREQHASEPHTDLRICAGAWLETGG